MTAALLIFLLAPQDPKASDGFTIEKVADANFPMFACFDDKGRLYGTMGQPDGYKLKARDGTMLTGKSGILFRCKPDGTDCEVLCRGFENLVEIVFMPNGDILGTCNWYQKPVGGIRDAIVHLVPGGLYPYVPDKGTAFPFTGDVIPPLALFPAVALSGMCRYDHAAFPEEMRGNLFTA